MVLLVISVLIWSLSVVAAVWAYWSDLAMGLSGILIIPVFVEFISMIVMSTRNRHAELEAPKVFRWLERISYFYTAVNFAICAFILRDGGPMIDNGVYCLWNHGFVRELTLEEYQYYLLVDARFFCGHLVLFAAAPMEAFAARYRQKKKQH